MKLRSMSQRNKLTWCGGFPSHSRNLDFIQLSCALDDAVNLSVLRDVFFSTFEI